MHAQRCACCVVHASLIRSGAALKEPVPTMATDALSTCDKKKRELVTRTLPPCLSFQNRTTFNSDSSDSCMLRSVEILTWSIRGFLHASVLWIVSWIPSREGKRERERERPLYPANRQYSQAILLRVAREWATTSSRKCLRSSSSWPSSVCVWWWKPLTRCSQKRQEMLVSA